MSIDSLRYESHQPPLYYALAAPVYGLFANAPGPWATPAPGLLALRLFSVIQGAGIILLGYAVARRILPARPSLALGTAAFIAFLPRNLAAAAQAGNDTLAELLLAAVLFALVEWVLSAEGTSPGKAAPVRRLLWLGILLGLIALTKTTAYFALALILGVLAWDWRRQRADAGRIARDLCLVGLPAALLALPWYARDLHVYGWPDFLGLRRHDLIVVGQLRPADYLALHGWGPYVRQLIIETFESFWAVFGWMGVFVDVRIYQALAVLSLTVAGGLALHERQARIGATLTAGQRLALRVLAASAVFSVLVYAWYNGQFVQFQGRYLFTALIPVAIAFGLGWDQALRSPGNLRLLAGGLLFLAVALAGWGLLAAHSLPKWPIAMALVGATILAACSCVSCAEESRSARLLHGLMFAAPYAGLSLLAVYALFGAIVPQLG